MRTIWKFPLRATDWQQIDMPAGACILSVHEQNGVPCLWAIVDEDAALESRRFVVVGTGHPLGGLTKANYIGTAYCGSLVWHVFEA